MEQEQQPKFTIDVMTVADIDEATEIRLQSWLDTYQNTEYGVTKEWIEHRNAIQRGEEKTRERKRRFETSGNPAWVARDEEGKIIGETTPYIDSDGVQHLGSLYIEKSWQGRGVASQLMQKVVEWSDPGKPIVLGAVAYNERAKAFYRKWGFVEIPDSLHMFANKIPEVMMTRKGDAQ